MLGGSGEPVQLHALSLAFCLERVVLHAKHDQSSVVPVLCSGVYIYIYSYW